jgi:hypothetical protein
VGHLEKLVLTAPVLLLPLLLLSLTAGLADRDVRPMSRNTRLCMGCSRLALVLSRTRNMATQYGLTV